MLYRTLSGTSFYFLLILKHKKKQIDCCNLARLFFHFKCGRERSTGVVNNVNDGCKAVINFSVIVDSGTLVLHQPADKDYLGHLNGSEPLAIFLLAITWQRLC